MPSKLDQLRTMTIVVADTGDIDAVRRLKPVDCTTNPTLILKAIADPLLAETFDEALSWGRRQAGGHEEIVSAVADRIAVSVGAALSQLVPGRVSTEVDADLSFDTNATVAKSRSVIEAYRARGIGRERVLVKIAATWEGIRAAEVLQRDEIDCNLTLVFNKAQAIACADAGVFLISPFVGRIYDWHVKNAGRTFEPEEDPGVQSVRTIYDYFKSHGVQTVVMGASFRSQGQIEALAGCDRLTISPALLDKLAVDDGRLERKLHAEPRRSAERIAMDERTFRRMMGEDPMATECLDRGIRSFDEDLKRLRAMIAARLTEAAPSSLVEA